MIPQANNRKVLVIGWDAADWRVINPMLEEDKLPHLKKFMSEGVSGNITTINPILSPMLWTSIATGKRPFKHGIHGFSEPTPNGSAIRPITNINRSCKAIWNILNQCGKKTNVVSWWPSHPAEPIDGVMVSNWFQPAKRLQNVKLDPTIGRPRAGNTGWSDEQWPMPPGAVHPESLSKNLQEFRFHPMELAAEHIGPFVPNFSNIDQAKDQRLAGLAKTLADTISVHAASTALMQLEPWDFMAIYYDGIDHFSHGFMKYHKTRQEWVSEDDFEMYKDVVEGAYRFHDMMLGTLLHFAGKDTTIIILSDHGFHPDHLRPEHIPVEPAGPAIEHRPYGVFLMKGPGIKKGETVHGASILDLCPTVLSLYDLPTGMDMDGKPLLHCFENMPEMETITSWEDIEGECGMHPPDSQLDSAQSAEAIKQLVELGYIEEPDENTSVAIRETVRELNYNLAQAYMDAGQFHEAIPLLEDIWAEFPAEHRFGFKLIDCRLAIEDSVQRAVDIEILRQNMAEHSIKAIEEVNSVREEAEQYGMILPRFVKDEDGQWKIEPVNSNDEALDKKDAQKKEPPKKFHFQVNKLISLLGPFDGSLAWLMATQAIAEGDHDLAIPMLEEFAKISNAYPDTYNQVGGCFLQLKRWDQALDVFNKALETDSENAAAHLGVAKCMLAKKNFAECIDHALSATELLFDNPIAHYILGCAFVATGDTQNALTALRAATSQAPNFIDAHQAMAELYEGELNDPKKAEQHRTIITTASKATQANANEDDIDAVYQDIISKQQKRRADLAARTDPKNISGKDTITIVSGLPRSGTSMMMQALQKGGMEPYTDSNREADSDNPRGYYEHEKATQLAKDKSWMPEARGKAVKIVAQLLSQLPKEEHYRIIFMDRDLREVIQSQNIMLERLGRQGGKLTDAKMISTLDRQVHAIENMMASHDNIDVLFVDYADALGDPKGTSKRIHQFLGGELDESGMASAIDPSLRRQKMTDT